MKQVEAQLGASRERVSELTWQLAESQERERAQVVYDFAPHHKRQSHIIWLTQPFPPYVSK